MRTNPQGTPESSADLLGANCYRLNRNTLIGKIMLNPFAMDSDCSNGNLVANARFQSAEDGILNNWTAFSSTAIQDMEVVEGGNMTSAKMTFTNQAVPFLSQSISIHSLDVMKGRFFTLTGKVFIASGSSDWIRPSLYALVTASTASPAVDGKFSENYMTNKWYEWSVTGYCPLDATACVVRLYAHNGSSAVGTVYFSDIRLVAGGLPGESQLTEY